MGTFSVTVNADPNPVVELISSTTNSCYSQFVIEVNVPSGTRYVEITSSDTAVPALTNISISEAIATDKQYTITIFGDNASTIQTGRVFVTVKDTNVTGALLATYNMIRKHSGNNC